MKAKKRMPRREFLEFKRANKKGWIADDFPLHRYGELVEETERCRYREIILEKENQTLKKAMKKIAGIIEGVDNRCMAADGPATRTLDEMTDNEMILIYQLASGGPQ